MSTRCNIIIRESERVKEHDIILYHHMDGYPECVGLDLKFWLEQNFTSRNWHPIFISNSLLKEGITHRCWDGDDNETDIEFDDGFDVTTCLHGDIEYCYVINCEEKTIKCYHRSFREDVENIFDEEHERDIPSNIIKVRDDDYKVNVHKFQLWNSTNDTEGENVLIAANSEYEALRVAFDYGIKAFSVLNKDFEQVPGYNIDYNFSLFEKVQGASALTEYPKVIMCNIKKDQYEN